MRRWSQVSTGWLLTAIVVTLGSGKASAADPQKVATQVDALLAREHFGGTAKASDRPAPRAADETFLRRVSLDLIGELPSPADAATFMLDHGASKRAAAVDRLLANEKFGVNWARYWRDVVFYRRSDDKALYAAPILEAYLTKQFNEGAHWDEMARQFITATGDAKADGNTAIIVAQMANPADTASEISRIFLGIQIQCAQCHNHPFDRWRREQFHELAAFFPRVGIVGKGKGAASVVSLTKAQNVKGMGRRELEHFMPDLKNPKAKGTLMQPVFFATGKKLDEGLADEERREKLAEWLTAREDGWFAKAFVNRVWSELVGRGFYEPVDDLGPDRKCSAPKTLDYLSKQFVASDHDVKWLYRTIVATAAYQRQSRSRPETSGAPMSATCPQRLRADQLYNSLAAALEFGEEAPSQAKKQDKNKNPGKNPAGRRDRINRTFGYDPSLRREDIAGSIPQALEMMNSTDLNRAISARQANTMLSKLLAEVKDDEKAVGELYRRCLARAPKPAELKVCLTYIGECKDRNEAFEDILWSLVNSSDFLYRE